VDLEALAQEVEEGGVKLWGLQTEIDRINREINALGAVNLAALDELTARASARPSWTRRTPT
jgi:chromosome segregation protein